MNDSGVILITVIIISIVICIVAIGIAGMHASQSVSNQRQIDRIKAEQMAKGAFWDTYMKEIAGIDPETNPTPDEPLDSKTFRVTIDKNPVGIPGIGTTEPYHINVEWDE